MPATLFKRELNTGVFLWNLWNFPEHLILKNIWEQLLLTSLDLSLLFLITQYYWKHSFLNLTFSWKQCLYKYFNQNLKKKLAEAIAWLLITRNIYMCLADKKAKIVRWMRGTHMKLQETVKRKGASVQIKGVLKTQSNFYVEVFLRK